MDNHTSNSCTVPLTKPDLNDLQLYEHDTHCSQRDRVRWKGNIALTIVSIIACICACVCATYCGFVLNEVKTIQSRISAHEASYVPVKETFNVAAKQTSDVNSVKTNEKEIIVEQSGDAAIDVEQYIDFDSTKYENNDVDIDSDYEFEDDDDDEEEDDDDEEEEDDDDDDDDDDEDVISETDQDDESDDEFEYLDDADEIKENGIDKVKQTGELSESQTDEIDVDLSGDGFLENFDDEDIIRKRRDVQTPTTKRPTGRRGKKGKKNKNKKKKNKNKKQRKRKLTYLPAAQFDGSVPDEVIRTRLQDNDFDTYKNKAETPLHIFKPANWVNNNTSPVTFDGKATFTAKYSGVHLVQAQLLFSGHERTRSASIVQTRAGITISLITCSMGVHRTHAHSQEGNQFHTCSIIGMMALQKDDTIQVYTNNREAQLETIQGTTHFGIVQLNRA